MNGTDTQTKSTQELLEENQNLQRMLEQSNESLRFLMETQSQLQEMYAKTLDAVMSHCGEAILFLDDEGRYVDANPAACVLTGYSHRELRRETVCTLMPQALREGCVPGWKNFIREGNRSGEYTLMHRDGSYVEVEYRMVASIAPGTHMMILQDITERKQAEAALSDEKVWSAHLDDMLQCIGALHRDSARGAFDALAIS